MSDNPMTSGLKEAENQYTWDRRRLMMYIVLMFCMTVIGYVLHNRLESRVAETVVTMAFGAIIAIVGAYVFGATWQDVARIKSVTTGPAQQQGEPGLIPRRPPRGE